MAILHASLLPPGPFPYHLISTIFRWFRRFKSLQGDGNLHNSSHCRICFWSTYCFSKISWAHTCCKSKYVQNALEWTLIHLMIYRFNGVLLAWSSQAILLYFWQSLASSLLSTTMMSTIACGRWNRSQRRNGMKQSEKYFKIVHSAFLSFFSCLLPVSFISRTVQLGASWQPNQRLGRTVILVFPCAKSSHVSGLSR